MFFVSNCTAKVTLLVWTRKNYRIYNQPFRSVYLMLKHDTKKAVAITATAPWVKQNNLINLITKNL
jgi:hypothetical protein